MDIIQSVIAKFKQTTKRISPGADQFVYTITYNGHMVTAIDGAIPEELAGVIDFLAALL